MSFPFSLKGPVEKTGQGSVLYTTSYLMYNNKTAYRLSGYSRTHMVSVGRGPEEHQAISSPIVFFISSTASVADEKYTACKGSNHRTRI